MDSLVIIENIETLKIQNTTNTIHQEPQNVAKRVNRKVLNNLKKDGDFNYNLK